MRVTRALLTFRSRWNSSNKNQRCFFGFSTFSVCLTTNDFTRANSFLQPFAKSRGPYSNSTTKQKARTAKRTSQNNPRSNAMAGRLACSEGMVNAMGPYSTSSPPRVRPVADKTPVDPPATMAVPKPESFSNEGTGILSSLNGKTETAMLWHDARAAARSKRTISRSRRADP